ncbi:MAG TPA: 4a-hydroxytetrahydrobiopterin dehydratase [Aestuariivirgaceae bacterium]|jgi:4a-hydroxytetrahydrobiopterin dehydratase
MGSPIGGEQHITRGLNRPALRISFASGFILFAGDVAPTWSGWKYERKQKSTGDLNMNSLAEKTCTPCKGGVPPLTADEAKSLLSQTPAWQLLDDARRIERRFSFRDFGQALGFVNRVAEIAETEGHHPDIHFGWGYATVSLQTKKIKGLHENDFIMASKIDRLPQ